MQRFQIALACCLFGGPAVYRFASRKSPVFVPFEVRLGKEWSPGWRRSANAVDDNEKGLPAFWYKDDAKIEFRTFPDRDGELTGSVKRMYENVRSPHPFEKRSFHGVTAYPAFAFVSGRQPHNPRFRSDTPVYGIIYLIKDRKVASIRFFCRKDFDTRKLEEVATSFRFLPSKR